MRGVRWLAMTFVMIVGQVGCAQETLGALEVTVRLQSPDGASLACVDLGAEQLELSLYAKSGDQVPQDQAVVDCEANDAGWAMFGLTVAAQSYQRVVLRFLTSSGDTVRICTSEGRVDAVLEQNEVRVGAGEVGSVAFELVGDTQPCTAVESP